MNYENIIISTGDIKEDYNIIDVIYACEHVPGVTKNKTHSQNAFKTLKANLKEQCYNLGGDAIINCQIRTEQSLDSIYAFFMTGTVVKIKNL